MFSLEKSCGQRSLAGLKESDTTEAAAQACTHTHYMFIFCNGEESEEEHICICHFALHLKLTYSESVYVKAVCFEEKHSPVC